jgi:hypothetical protein
MNRGTDLILASWERSVTQHDGMTMSVRGETLPERKKREDNASWTDTNLTGPKNKEIYTVYSIVTYG